MRAGSPWSRSFLVVGAGDRSIRTSVRRRCSILCLAFAWICANGAMLDAVQVVAWVRMFAGYSCALPVGAALRATFDPARPCELCLVVAKARASAPREAPASPARSGEKLVLAFAAQAILTFPPRPEAWPSAGPEVAPARVEPVPVRPPRAALV
jgi:hypothetical protein